LIVAIATLVFVLYSGQQQRELYAQIKELNAETVEIMERKVALSAQTYLPNPSSEALEKFTEGIKATHVRKTTCSAASEWCTTEWVLKSQATN
jgi:RNA polymerase-interacting CarD/CdnL/TRCF family regulator